MLCTVVSAYTISAHETEKSMLLRDITMKESYFIGGQISHDFYSFVERSKDIERDRGRGKERGGETGPYPSTDH